MERLLAPASDVGARLKQRGETIAIAESSTGGLISAALLAVPGASAYYKGGGVIYTRDARRALLNLPAEVLTMPGANEAYAMIVAKTMRENLGADWGFCETGASGPTGNRYGDPAGHTCYALAGSVETSLTIQTGLSDREENMQRFAEQGFGFLQSALADQG